MNALTLTPIDGEPRIFDLTLAERLGFEQPRNIRKLVKRNLTKLQRFGHCATVARCIEIGNGAKQEVDEFYLNQKQAVWVCMKSETDLAFDVQAEIVRVFDAYLLGDLIPAESLPPANPPNRLSAEMKKRINRRAWRLAPVACSEYRLRMLAIAQSSALAFIPERWTPSAYMLEPKPYLLPQPDPEAQP
jgi:hypothetical protein